MKFVVYLLIYVYIMAFPAWLCWKNKIMRDIAKIEENRGAYIICTLTYYCCLLYLIIANLLFIRGLIYGK